MLHTMPKLFAAQNKTRSIPVGEHPERTQEPPAELVRLAADLDSRQVEALQLLMNGETVARVAKQVGVTKAVLRGWIQGHEDFRFALAYLRAELMMNSHDVLRIGLNEAIVLLRDTVADMSQTPGTRIKAAGKLIDIAMKLPPVEPRKDKTEDELDELQRLAQTNPDVQALLIGLKEALDDARERGELG